MPFQSTPPVRGATTALSFPQRELTFQSTPPVRGATMPFLPFCPYLESFNPRPPCGERLCPLTAMAASSGFQSTPPVRGATLGQGSARKQKIVSIHAPRAGSDIQSHG